MSAAQESPESRLATAGFARSAHLWLAPNNGGAMSQEDAIARLDRGEIQGATVTVPDSGVRAFPDELVERMFAPPEPKVPQWLLEQLSEHLRPVIRAEVRAVVRKGRK
jgi:hypothetical protein